MWKHFLLTFVITTIVCESKKNVLFIAIDDLRAELGAYVGTSYGINTSNIDYLSNRSLVFERAYCQIAVCSPSRTSLLTGRRPDTNHVWQIADDEYWRNYTNATTIPQYFKENGYISIGMGKIFHPGVPNGNDDSKYSWSPEGLPYYHSPLQGNYTNYSSTSYSLNYPDDQLPDGQIADKAIQYLKDLKANKTKRDQRPFFLAVGFHKPHLPFIAPSKYFDMYPVLAKIKLAINNKVPEGMPPIAYSTWMGLDYKDLNIIFNYSTLIHDCLHKPEYALYNPICGIPDWKARILKQAYWACMSYVDAQVGKVMKELEIQGLDNDTITVLWSDHGRQLGEHNEWAEFTNFEVTTRVPLMIRVPGITDKGMRTKALVELIDIFPSLTELAGIDVPPVCPEGKHSFLACVEGTSIAPLLKDPDQNWKKGAFSQFPRPSSGLEQIPEHPQFDHNEHGENVMGYTVRVDNYRFTEWYRFNRTIGVANFSDIWGTELYDHNEPSIFFNDENTNIAEKSEMKSTVEELRRLLQSGWRAALPPSAHNNDNKSVT